MDEVDKFQNNILKNYKNYKLTKKNPSFNLLCFPDKFTYQLPQLFVSNFINPKTDYKGLLIFHKIGAGKTCAAIQIAEQWKNNKKIIITCPKSLVNNFYKEIRSECTGNIYVSNSERNKLNTLDIYSTEYKNLINTINNKINKKYNIYSYNKFIELIENKEINLNNSLLIIDEIQNLVSEFGIYYKIIYDAIKKTSSSFRIVIMSATPIFDKPMELGRTLNLLKPKKEFPVGQHFNDEFLDINIINNKPILNIKNADKLKLMLNGLVSYYKGAPDYVFPKKIIKIVKCPMSKYQYNCYKIIEKKEGNIDKLELFKLPTNFFLGSRILSNIAYPNKYVNQQGLDALDNNNMKLHNLKKYSTKFYYILKKILKSKGTIFIYSNFKEFGGLLPFIKILEYYNFSNFLKYGEGKKRFAIFSGNENINDKEKIRTVFNDINNVNGYKLKIILGSPACKEGVSFLRVKQVHIIDVYWNMSRIEQVIGRAVRFCSHKDVEPDERYVKVYLYLSTVPKDKTKEKNKKKTIDQYIYEMAQNKKIISDKFEKVIIDASIDKKLFTDI